MKRIVRLSEQSNEPSMRVITKLFKLLDEEKKKNRTRASLLEAIKNFAPYMGIPKGFEQYILELYVLNFRKDGDYSNLTKENFVDPRKQSGKVVSNPKAKLYTIAQLPFRGSNLQGFWSEDPKGTPYYKVVSYEWYPIYIFKDDKWYEITNTYSSSTSRQISNANPVSWGDDTFDNVYTLTADEMKLLERGYSHEDIMKNKVKKLKNIEPDLTKRKKTAKTYNYWNQDPEQMVPNTNIKFKVRNIEVGDDNAIINIDVYDVFKRENNTQVYTPQNYLRGEIDNLTPTKVEDAIKIKMRGELKDYIGKRFRWVAEDPKGAKIGFKFNHLKQPGLQENIHRIQSMMGVITEDETSLHIRRRMPYIKQLLDVVLDNSYPCDFDSVKHYEDGILYDINDFLISFEMDDMSSSEIKEFILQHLTDDIERYYYDRRENC